MCSPTWETHILNDMCSLPGKHISLVIYVSISGKHISLVICVSPPGKHVSLMICVPLPGKHMSLVICVPLCLKHISLVICVPLPVKRISLVIRVPLPRKHLFIVLPACRRLLFPLLPAEKGRLRNAVTNHVPVFRWVSKILGTCCDRLTHSAHRLT